MKAIEDMTVHELRTKKDELVAELRAVVARIQDFEWAEITPPVGWSSKVQRKPPPASEPNPEPVPGQPGGPNARQEGEDAA